ASSFTYPSPIYIYTLSLHDALPISQGINPFKSPTTKGFLLLLPQFFFIKGILKLIFLNNFIPNILSPAITINSAANSWINPCIFIDIENTEPKAPIIPPSNVYEITLPRLYLSAVLKDDFLLTSKLSLSRVCVSIIPPHIPTQ